MRWPRSSSGTPTTATSCTDGWSAQRCLDLTGTDLEAAGLDDVHRSGGPTMRWKPSASMTAASPVRNHSAVERRHSSPRRARGSRRTGWSPRTCSSPIVAPSCATGFPSSSTRRVATPSIGTPTQPGRRSPSARVRERDERLRHAVALHRCVSGEVAQLLEHPHRQRGAAGHQQPGAAQCARGVRIRARPDPTRWAHRSRACRRPRRTGRASVVRCGPTGSRRAARRALRARGRARGTVAGRAPACRRRVHCHASARPSSPAATARRDSTTPFGAPVVPDV